MDCRHSPIDKQFLHWFGQLVFPYKNAFRHELLDSFHMTRCWWEDPLQYWPVAWNTPVESTYSTHPKKYDSRCSSGLMYHSPCMLDYQVQRVFILGFYLCLRPLFRQLPGFFRNISLLFPEIILRNSTKSYKTKFRDSRKLREDSGHIKTSKMSYYT